MSSVFASAKSWPFQEAARVLARLKRIPKAEVVFETGYGPSGLPHIGTFGEVARTTMVRRAFACLSDIPTRLLCFSDDMDGLRKVPDNIPNPEKMAPFLNFQLTSVPDPFGTHDSFGAHNNARLRSFLDELGVEYTFMSSTECYRSGLFDDTLLQVLAHHQDILNTILPTLGPERQQTYSPFLPISPKTGRVLQVAMQEYRDTTVVFRDEDGTLTELPVTGGHCKLQWKVDWGMRWKALGVDYEMAGKDLIDSVTLATKVCKILGGEPPENLICEHFLDEEGRKISKSKGNGLSVEDWLRYAPMESLAYYMALKPKTAKRLFFDVIPRHTDEYLQLVAAYPGQDSVAKVDNPVWSVHNGQPPAQDVGGLSFSLLLNLAAACQAHDKAMLWGYITRLNGHLTPKTHPFLDRLVSHAVTYYQDRVRPHKVFRAPSLVERAALEALAQRLGQLDTSDPQVIQHEAYEVGKKHFDDLKNWFSCFYQVLLGEDSGPRVGSFIALYGIKETCDLIAQKLQDWPAV
jgi:lysyl-tRNA synthetase, class I